MGNDRSESRKGEEWISINDRLPPIGTDCECRGVFDNIWRVTHWRERAPVSETGPSEDTKRLDWLDKQGSSVPFGWIARGSTTGRGFRLHQEPTHHFGETHQNVRDAIDAARDER